jgi:hypothetical protein
VSLLHRNILLSFFLFLLHDRAFSRRQAWKEGWEVARGSCSFPSSPPFLHLSFIIMLPPPLFPFLLSFLTRARHGWLALSIRGGLRLEVPALCFPLSLDHELFFVLDIRHCRSLLLALVFGSHHITLILKQPRRRQKNNQKLTSNILLSTACCLSVTAKVLS